MNAATRFLTFITCHRTILFVLLQPINESYKEMRANIIKLAQALKRACVACANHAGLPLVYMGVALLAIFYIAGWTNNNLLLLLPLALMLVGTIGFVRNEKQKETY